tara:strand:- start:5513 stop:5956 length:444 start_codon:yes stop_codon:yes gene_type:complete
MRKIDGIICHCSASDEANHDNVEIIRSWHVARGWDDIGYHFFIQKDGNLQIGRPIIKDGAHCYGQNKTSIGICLAGNGDFTEFQFKTLKKLCLNLCEIFGLDDSQIYPHWYFNENKKCPIFGLGEVRHYVGKNRNRTDKGSTGGGFK